MMPARWLARGGLQLAVHDSGTGPLILFQHGLGGDAAQTAEACPPDLHRLTLECAGHGQSDEADTYSIAGFADDVAALLAPLNRPVIVAGISMGAAIATRLAVKNPGLVSALALVRPAWTTKAAPENMAAIAEVARLMAQDATPAATFAKSVTARHLALAAPDNLASLSGFFTRPQATTAGLLAQIAQDGPGITEADLHHLKIPTLVMGCAEDVIHPLAHASTLARLIPGARLVELPAKGRNKPAHIAALHQTLTLFLKET